MHVHVNGREKVVSHAPLLQRQGSKKDPKKIVNETAAAATRYYQFVISIDHLVTYIMFNSR